MKSPVDAKTPSIAIWTRPVEVNAVLQRLWSSGQLLAARLTGETLFPLSLPLRRPRASFPEDRCDEARRWIDAFERGDRTHRGFGYELIWVEVVHRRRGRLRVPDRVVVPSESDALKLIGKDADAKPFDALARKTLLPAGGGVPLAMTGGEVHGAMINDHSGRFDYGPSATAETLDNAAKLFNRMGISITSTDDVAPKP